MLAAPQLSLTTKQDMAADLPRAMFSYTMHAHGINRNVDRACATQKLDQGLREDGTQAWPPETDS